LLLLDGSYKPDVAYKKKVEEGEEGEEVPVEEEKVNRAPVVTETVVEEIIGVSLEDFFKTRSVGVKKEARKAEGVQGKKVEQFEANKVNQTTVLKTNYGMQTSVTAKTNGNLMGFSGVPDEEEQAPAARGGRGGRGGDRGGARGGRGTADAARGGARRQNPKQSLKKTEEDFPSL
jgi:hypothetical protein